MDVRITKDEPELRYNTRSFEQKVVPLVSSAGWRNYCNKIILYIKYLTILCYNLNYTNISTKFTHMYGLSICNDYKYAGFIFLSDNLHTIFFPSIKCMTNWNNVHSLDGIYNEGKRPWLCMHDIIKTISKFSKIFKSIKIDLSLSHIWSINTILHEILTFS